MEQMSAGRVAGRTHRLDDPGGMPRLPPVDGGRRPPAEPPERGPASASGRRIARRDRMGSDCGTGSGAPEGVPHRRPALRRGGVPRAAACGKTRDTDRGRRRWPRDLARAVSIHGLREPPRCGALALRPSEADRRGASDRDRAAARGRAGGGRGRPRARRPAGPPDRPQAGSAPEPGARHRRGRRGRDRRASTPRSRGGVGITQEDFDRILARGAPRAAPPHGAVPRRTAAARRAGPHGHPRRRRARHRPERPRGGARAPRSAGRGGSSWRSRSARATPSPCCAEPPTRSSATRSRPI